MKVLRIPCFILLALLVLTLYNSAMLSRRCSSWSQLLQQADRQADAQQWAAAGTSLESLCSDWNHCQTWLHIVIEHREIDTAEALLQRCRVLCQEQDDVEFRATLSDLASQLKLLDEMERVSIKNIL